MLALLGIYTVGFVLTFLYVFARGDKVPEVNFINALVFAAVWPAYVVAVLVWMFYPRR